LLEIPAIKVKKSQIYKMHSKWTKKPTTCAPINKASSSAKEGFEKNGRTARHRCLASETQQLMLL
jgi:hypothetical protein